MKVRGNTPHDCLLMAQKSRIRKNISCFPFLFGKYANKNILLLMDSNGTNARLELLARTYPTKIRDKTQNKKIVIAIFYFIFFQNILEKGL